jgi:hypothetical protein
MKKIALIILTAIFALNVQAQTLRTSYFMDKYTHRHQWNPALTPAWGYVNFPVLSNLQLGLNSNMKIADYLYPGGIDGSLKTFMHESISSNEFLKKIGRGGETAGFDVSLSLLGIGFYTGRDLFWSLDVNLKAYGGANVPKDFFAFLKEMDFGHGNTYNFKDLNVAGRSYVELALGHARDINDDIRAGVKVKPLIGLADFRFKVDDMKIHTTIDEWTATVNATGDLLGGGLIEIDDTASKFGDKFKTVDKITTEHFLGSYGVAFDFGVSWTMDKFLDEWLGALVPFSLKGFTASFSITDLGFIRWKNAAQIGFDKNFVYDGVRVEYNDSLSILTDHITEQFEDLMNNLKTTGEKNGVFRGLRTTTNLGLEYSFLNNKMSAGLLWTTTFGLPKVWNELTFSYNLRPNNWFALSLSSSVAHGFFRSAGWAINLTPKYGLTFFIGMDYVPFAWTPKLTGEGDLGLELPIGLPIYSTNLNFNLGMSIPLGGNRYHKFPSKRELRRIEAGKQEKFVPKRKRPSSEKELEDHL